MSRVQAHGIILIVLVGALAVISLRGAGDVSAPMVDMQTWDWLPLNIEGWEGVQEVPPEQWSQQLPNAHFLVRFYKSGQTIVEFLAIESADPGSFHSPMFCMPGTGWTPKETGVGKLESGEVSRAEFVQDFAQLVVRYWYLAGDRQTANLWVHKWNMLWNKIQGIHGPNFSFRVTVRFQGPRDPAQAADEFANIALREIRRHVESRGVAQR